MSKKSSKVSTENDKRSYLSQSDVPGLALESALRVPRALADSYAKQPTRPLRVAEALEMTPTSGTFRTLCGASIAYGLTEGGYNAETIALTDLGRRIVAPTEEGDDQKAMKTAFMQPQIVGKFLTKYDGSKLPTETIARNVLAEFGVPSDATERTYRLIVGGARQLGLLVDIKGSLLVDLNSTQSLGAEDARSETTPSPLPGMVVMPALSVAASKAVEELANEPTVVKVNNRVFITHGKNLEIVDQLKPLLTYGGFEPHLEIEKENIAVSLPDKVMKGMSSCGAAVIHVGLEERLLTPDGQERRMLNQNVLIEIGAAMALYGKRFILLVEKGVQLPSNLQGLYQVRYEGERLDFEATMKLLNSLNEMKKAVAA